MNEGVIPGGHEQTWHGAQGISVGDLTGLSSTDVGFSGPQQAYQRLELCLQGLLRSWGLDLPSGLP